MNIYPDIGNNVEAILLVWQWGEQNEIQIGMNAISLFFSSPWFYIVEARFGLAVAFSWYCLCAYLIFMMHAFAKWGYVRTVIYPASTTAGCRGLGEWTVNSVFSGLSG